MTENWLQVVDYDGLYECSDQGKVRSLTRQVSGPHGSKRTIQGRILKPATDKGGYKTIVLCKNNITATKKIHCLVCGAFIGSRPEGLIVRHLDGNPANNNLSNLIYGTYSENEADKDLHGNSMRGDNHYKTKLTKDDVLAIRASGESCIKLARHYGVTDASISGIRLRKTWAHV